MARIIFCLTIIAFSQFASAQSNPPWERPLKVCTSTDGQTFTTPVIFQDSSGVPSAMKWKGDTLICVFQWFHQPMNSPTWDKVAVKFSYDSGLSWTLPVPIVVNGIPSNYQRPFDPAIARINSDSLRIFFSSSDGMPVAGGDSIINTYSAKSTDGINYTFEPGARYDNQSQRVIDPSAVIYDGEWQYVAPIGAPQDGAYHCTSINGINFTQNANILSDPQHNWTGNFMVDYATALLRFYGSGQHIWYNLSDGITWYGYTYTNITGGDPAVIQINDSNYIMIFVGEPYLSVVEETGLRTMNVFPNPVTDYLKLQQTEEFGQSFSIYTSTGSLVKTGNTQEMIDVSTLAPGYYILLIDDSVKIKEFHFIRE